MKKGLKTLMRLKDMDLDIIRREIAALQSEIDEIDAKSKELDKQLLSEQVYLTRLEGLATYADYAQSVKVWQQDLAVKKLTIEEKLDAKRQQLGTVFEEKKTVSIAFETLLEKEAAHLKRAEQSQLDEAALSRYARSERAEK